MRKIISYFAVLAIYGMFGLNSIAESVEWVKIGSRSDGSEIFIDKHSISKWEGDKVWAWSRYFWIKSLRPLKGESIQKFTKEVRAYKLWHCNERKQTPAVSVTYYDDGSTNMRLWNNLEKIEVTTSEFGGDEIVFLCRK